MEKSAQKVFDRADIVRDVRLTLPAQPVDATLFKLLIGQRFPVENRNVRP
jgi:hypothetical protein